MSDQKLPKILIPMVIREFPIITRPRAIWSHFEPTDTKKGREIQIMQINHVLKEVINLYEQGNMEDAIDDIKGILNYIQDYQKKNLLKNGGQY